MEETRQDLETLFRMLAARTKVIEALERRVAALEERLDERRPELSRPMLRVVETPEVEGVAV
jgi:uncharacterized coiled-coil protein SlyX